MRLELSLEAFLSVFWPLHTTIPQTVCISGLDGGGAASDTAPSPLGMVHPGLARSPVLPVTLNWIMGHF